MPRYSHLSNCPFPRVTKLKPRSCPWTLSEESSVLISFYPSFEERGGVFEGKVSCRISPMEIEGGSSYKLREGEVPDAGILAYPCTPCFLGFRCFPEDPT